MNKAREVRIMFSRIASRYDRMNSLMTFGLHSHWRRMTANATRPAGGLALDVGTGTGDLAIALARAGAARVIAADFSELMLNEAQHKVALGVKSGQRLRLIAADALRLPFPDATFDCAANGFVLRNVADLPATLSELHRVLKPGGRLACLELTPASGPIAPFFRPYFERLVPIMGRIVAGDAAAYTYLPASVRPFPNADRLASILRDAGFSDVRYRRVGLGTVCIHIGTKPASS